MAETERLIGELKNVVMELHRSAGNLDMLIREIEDQDYRDPEWLACYIASESNLRNEFIRVREWDNLIEKECSLWEALIASVKEKES